MQSNVIDFLLVAALRQKANRNLKILEVSVAHHYVPMFYFKNFTFNSDQSLVFSMNHQGEIHENAIGDISAQKNYNTPEQEREQSQLETRHSVILRKFIETFDSGNSNHSRGFVEFVSFLMGNNIYVRKQMAEFLSQMKLEI